MVMTRERALTHDPWVERQIPLPPSHHISSGIIYITTSGITLLSEEYL
jgi:hypothetical protein